MPFLINLTDADKKKIIKMKDKNLPFVLKAFQAAQQNPAILTVNFDMDGYTKDVNLTTALTETIAPLKQLVEKMEDTLTIAGSEAMTTSLDVYELVKSSIKKTPGMKTVADELSERFKKGSKKPQPPEKPNA